MTNTFLKTPIGGWGAGVGGGEKAFVFPVPDSSVDVNNITNWSWINRT